MLDDRVEGFLPPTGDVDFGAVDGEGLCDHEPDAGAAAGDECGEVGDGEEGAGEEGGVGFGAGGEVGGGGAAHFVVGWGGDNWFGEWVVCRYIPWGK